MTARGAADTGDGAAAPIDVVIPVYNAPALTRRCIDSLYRTQALADQLGQVHVHDNASGSETRAMLDALRHPRLTVHHAERNTGFGDAVNQGVRQTKSELVLVLNSDVEARGDFLSPLRTAMRAEPLLAAVTPAGNTFASYDLSRYALRSGCVVTHNLYAYAFLVRRALFEAIGPFDPAFGLGYFEDTDLSRKLIRAGHWLGVHAGSQLHHEIHGSFGEVPKFRDWIERNRELYLARYPHASRQVLIASGATPLAGLPAAARADLAALLQGGGGAHWLTRAALEDLPALEVRADRWSLAGLRRALRRHRHKSHHRFSEVWLTRDAPALARTLLPRWAALQSIALRAMLEER